MNAAFRPDGNSSDPAAKSGSGLASRVIFWGVLFLGVTAALTVMAYASIRAARAQAALQESADRLKVLRGLIQPTRKRLAPEYADKQGRLLADPPGDLGQMLDPDTLVLAHYVDADVKTQLVDWDALQAALAKATGKQVVGQEYRNSADDVAAIKQGKIQLVALHAADAPYIVNNAGFIPVAVLGTESGAQGNRLDIAVKAKSPIQTLADIRGHQLTCTAPDSVTGYRAAIVTLLDQTGMRPDVDYSITFSFGQKRSILGLLNGQIEVAALSDDKVHSMLKKGSIADADYRLLYQSEVIPRLTIGYTYNLKPELAAQVTATALAFRNEAGAPEGPSGQPMQFFATDYKKDFEFVRKIDDAFDPRFAKMSNATETAEPASEPASSEEPAMPGDDDSTSE